MNDQDKHEVMMEAISEIRQNQLEIRQEQVAIRKEQVESRAEMKPVVDTFNTLRTLGIWVGVLVAFLGSITALTVGVRTLFKK